METLPIDDVIHRAVIARIPSTHGWGKHYARNAVESLRRAWAIRAIDPEIAAFRSMHAEEEAAAALFCGLKDKGYPSAEGVNPRNHIHKAAIQPYFTAVLDSFRGTVFKGATIRPYWEPDRPGHGFVLDVAVTGEDGQEQHYKVFEPLSFTVQSNGVPVGFQKEFENIVSTANAKSIRDYLRELANERNLALYARPNGIPKLDDDIQQYIQRRLNRTIRVLLVFVIIDLEKDRQLFVEQALLGFLRLLNLISEDDAKGALAR